MERLITAFDETARWPEGKARNIKRDAIFSAMKETVSADFVLNTKNLGLGSVMSALAFIKTYPDAIDGTIVTFVCECSIRSEYATDKTRKVFASVMNEGVSSCSNSMYDFMLSRHKPSKDSVLGALLGCATGDALGLPIEGFPQNLCTQYVREIVVPEMIPSYHRFNFKFGQYSDDTQLTREFYLAVSQNGGRIDPTVFGLRIAALFQPGAYRIVGYGAQTARAAEALRKGVSAYESGCSNGQGNGSIMRSPAVGIVFAQKDKKTVIQAAKTLSSITHASSAAIDGSVAVALATKYAVCTRNTSFDPMHFVEYIKEGVSSSFSTYLDEVLTMSRGNLAMELVAKRIVEIGTSNGERRWGDGISIGSRQTALWALYCFITHPDSYKDCVSLAIAVGGDVDTTAATVGAIVGSRVGYDRIPALWKQQVHDMDEWKHDELCEVARKVWRLIDEDKISWNGDRN